MKEYTVYPGEYCPVPGDESLVEENSGPTRSNGAKPLVNMNEFDDYFTIEMMLPGVKRDDIILQIRDRVLSITIARKHCHYTSENKFQIHEFDASYLKRSILLPCNADSVFINAEYEDGILHLLIPKTNHPAINTPTRIIVY